MVAIDCDRHFPVFDAASMDHTKIQNVKSSEEDERGIFVQIEVTVPIWRVAPVAYCL